MPRYYPSRTRVLPSREFVLFFFFFFYPNIFRSKNQENRDFRARKIYSSSLSLSNTYVAKCTHLIYIHMTYKYIMTTTNGYRAASYQNEAKRKKTIMLQLSSLERKICFSLFVCGLSRWKHFSTLRNRREKERIFFFTRFSS